MDRKLKVFKEDNNKEFRLVQNSTKGEADFNQFLRLRNQLVLAAGNFPREKNLSPVLIPTLSRDIAGQLKLAQKVVDVVDWANRKTCVTLLRYSVDKPESSFAQVRLFSGKMEDEKFKRIVFVNYKLGKFIHRLDVMNSVYDNLIANKTNFNVYKKYLHFFTPYHFSFYSNQDVLEQCR